MLLRLLLAAVATQGPTDPEPNPDPGSHYPYPNRHTAGSRGPNCRGAFVAAAPVGLVSLASAVASRNWTSTSPTISVLERGRGRMI
jgi:hypothetical protein